MADSGRWQPVAKADMDKWQALQDRSVPLPVQTLGAEHIPAKRTRPKGIRAAGFQIAFGLRPPEPPATVPSSAGGPGATAGFEPDVDASWPAPQQPPPPAAAAAGGSFVLDGFMLLAMSRCEFPDEATRIVCNGEHATSVAQEDLEYFTKLAFLDIGDNRLPLAPFGALPQLQELRMPCNMLATLPEQMPGFPVLEVLDLSFNALGPDQILSLASLPALRELDLTCNGLERLPNGMERLSGLQELSLERNRLSGDEPLMVLAYMTHLRKLNLAFNYLKRAPPNVRNATARVQWFPNLEWLSLANNYIADEDAIAPLSTWPRLEQLMLYGNPITAALGGEDRDGLAHLVKEDETQRPLTVMTVKPGGGGPGGGRRGSARTRMYANTPLTAVDDPLVPGNSAFRKRRGQEREQQQQQAGVSNPLPEWEEEEQGAAEEQQQQQQQQQQPQDDNRPRPGRARGDEGTFLTGVVFSDSESDDDDHDHERQDPDDPDAPGDLEVPPLFLRTDLSGQTQSPAKLRTALSALRYALKHPLTSDHVPTKGERQLTRPTAVHKLRQRPRVPYEPRVGAGELDDAQQRRVNRRALQNMEGVLDSMNERVAHVQADTSAAAQSEQTMESLINMVNRVMDTYQRG